MTVQFGLIIVQKHWGYQMKNRYRIVTDDYAGYEVQVWRCWWPFWWQAGFANTFLTVEDAEAFAIRHAKGVVKYLGWL
jgi:hypothetical protein